MSHMPNNTKAELFAYVKVEILTHHPRRWIWKVCKHSDARPVMTAQVPMVCAESAWDAGRKALMALDHGKKTIAP